MPANNSYYSDFVLIQSTLAVAYLYHTGGYERQFALFYVSYLVTPLLGIQGPLHRQHIFINVIPICHIILWQHVRTHHISIQLIYKVIQF